MIKNIRFCGIAVATATALSSCYYDPYFSYTGATYGGTYSSSSYYGGGGSYSSSVFISTGNPEWGYDPSCYSYYNYRRRCYYDPYLNGFYPVGYRPPVFVGCVHPHGWRPGSSYCPPPSRVSNITIVNYRNRESAYRSAGYIQHGHREQYATQQSRPETKPSFFQRPTQEVRPQQNYTRPSPGFQQQSRPSREPQREQPQTRPSAFNTLVNTRPETSAQPQTRPSFGSSRPTFDRGQQSGQSSRPSFGGNREQISEGLRRSGHSRVERSERKPRGEQEAEQAQP
ncbi:MAG: hypothetical protein ACO3F7_01645 [Luteolibacter sp.]